MQDPTKSKPKTYSYPGQFGEDFPEEYARQQVEGRKSIQRIIGLVAAGVLSITLVKMTTVENFQEWTSEAWKVIREQVKDAPRITPYG